MIIEQVKRTDERLMTALRAKVDGVEVEYSRLEHEAGYVLRVLHTVPVETAREAAKAITEVLCYQSYDHGQEWRITSFEYVTSGDDPLNLWHTFIMKYRIRDSY